MRLAAYGAASTAVAIGVILSAFNQRANFYSACVYLAQSNACLMVLTNLLILLSLILGHALQRLFYGPLRATEIEQIYEKAWYAVTETCLAMTIFRDEFDVRFIIMFGILLFVKCFSWIGAGRVEFMEQQPPERPWLFHVRLASSLVLLAGACGGLVWHAVVSVLERGKPNMMVMFAFEFAILLITSIGILSRYVLSLTEKWILYQEAQRRKEIRQAQRTAALSRIAEQTRENERRRAAGEDELPVEDLPEEDEDEELDVGGWEEKGTWVFYSELATDFMKLLTYLSFFWIVIRWYGLPLHIVRDVYLTLRSFITRIRDFVRYRRATAHMNSRYPDATAPEVEREGVCIICREEMRPWTAENEHPDPNQRPPGSQDQRHRAKKLPCGHVLHFSCLRSWLERQQRCPTCRRPVLDEAPATTPTPQQGQQQQARGNGQPPNGLAFQAQFGIGPLGFDIGVGRPGVVQGIMDRLNQQQQQAQQAQQPQAQGQNHPPPPPPPPPAGQEAPAQQPQPQPNGVPPDLPFQTPRFTNPMTAGFANIDRLQAEMQHTMMMMQRERLAMEESLRRLRAEQANLHGAHTPTPPPQPQAAEASQPPPQPNFPTHLPPFSSQTPSGITLPPGWSLIPLTPLTTTGAASPIPTPTIPTTATNGNRPPLATRRSQRSYRDSLHTYHSTLPTTTSSSSSSSEPTISFLSDLLSTHITSGRPAFAATILRGLPHELGTKVLASHPQRDVLQGELLRLEVGGDDATDVAIRAVATTVSSWGGELDGGEAILRGLGGLEGGGFVDRVLGLARGGGIWRSRLARLESQPEPAPTPTPTTSEPSQPAAQSTDNTPTIRASPPSLVSETIQTLNTVSQDPIITPSFHGEERLNLFGENSVFGTEVQREVLDQIRDEARAEEEGEQERRRREEERRRGLERILGGLAGGSGSSGELGMSARREEKRPEVEVNGNSSGGERGRDGGRSEEKREEEGESNGTV